MAWDVGTFIANLNAIADQIPDKALIGLEKGAEYVGQKADDQVPLDEGPLQNSRKVTVATLTAAISYNTPYAVIQHENMTFVHPGGRKAKYLEDPLNTEGPKVADIVKAEMDGLFS